MNSYRLGTRLVAVVGGAALIGLGTLTACGKGEKHEGPETTTTTTTTTATTPPASSPAPTGQPTEKSLDPRGGNLFTPGHTAQPAPTEPPGVHRNN